MPVLDKLQEEMFSYGTFTLDVGTNAYYSSQNLPSQPYDRIQAIRLVCSQQCKYAPVQGSSAFPDDVAASATTSFHFAFTDGTTLDVPVLMLNVGRTPRVQPFIQLGGKVIDWSKCNVFTTNTVPATLAINFYLIYE